MSHLTPKSSDVAKKKMNRAPVSGSRASRKQTALSYSSLEPRAMLAVVISEFVASNVSSFEDGYGSTPDWIELYNTGDTPIDLNGYHLSDDPANPFSWRFDQSAILGAQEYLVVFASGNNEVDPGGFFHTDFRLSAGGEYIGLFDPSGDLLSEFGSNGQDYPAQVTDISYGVGSDGSIGHLEFPTPLSGNSSSTTLGPNAVSYTHLTLPTNREV